MHRIVFVIAAALAAVLAPRASGAAGPATRPAANPSPYAAWKNGPPTDPSFFPIGVWVQNPRNAKRYRNAGVNLYVGLYRGPTEEQLRDLKEAGMRVICAQRRGLAFKDDATIVGWLQPDEPDNAQPTKDPKTGKSGWGPSVKPEKVVADYERLRTADPTRPVMLNLGQGVANDAWYGRGPGAKREDYLTYVRGGDVVSFDFYPVGGEAGQDGNARLPLVAKGVRRLVEWTGGRKVVWAILECSRIHNTDHKPTARQIRAQVWMALVHGAQGIVWFAHQFDPDFREAAVLDDPDLLAAVTAVNRQIHELAPVLNSPSVTDGASVSSSDEKAPIAVMTKRHGGATYVFSVALANAPARGTFELPGLPDGAAVEVIGESRKVDATAGKFADDFDGYAVHLYRIPGAQAP
jgi:hypothetical protein